METVYDWITVLIFAGLVTLYLQRSMGEDAGDSIWSYLVGGAGCAISNYLGNEGYDILAVAMIAATLLYVALVLKPFSSLGSG